MVTDDALHSVFSSQDQPDAKITTAVTANQIQIQIQIQMKASGCYGDWWFSCFCVFITIATRC